MDNYLNEFGLRKVLNRLKVEDDALNDLLHYKNEQLQQQIIALQERLYECCLSEDTSYMQYAFSQPGYIWEDEETGVQWRVLVATTDEHGGIGNALLLTEQTHGFFEAFDEANLGGTIWTTGWSYVPFEQSLLYGTMQNWFNSDVFVSQSLRNVALNAEIPIETPSYATLTLNETNLITHPWAASAPVGETGNGIIFPLSLAELNTFLGNANAERATSHFGIPPNGINPNTGALVTTTTSPYSLRTTGVSAVAQTRNVAVSGSIVSNAADSTIFPFRAALWVRP